MDFIEAEIAKLEGVPASLQGCLESITERARALDSKQGGWRTLPEICMEVHMHTTGSSDLLTDEQHKEALNYLAERQRSWTTHKGSTLFDMAVLNLVTATINEAEEQR